MVPTACQQMPCICCFTTASSSMPISSRRPASPAGSATASRSPPAPRRPTWTATMTALVLGISPDRCASCRPRSAAASAPSSTCPCSPSSRSRPGLGRPVAHGLHAPGIDHVHHQAPSGRMTMTVGCDADGRLPRIDFSGDFDTGAYASWGPTVANRVPVHASGPYFVPALPGRGAGDPHQWVPAGAFRGFGVPQMADRAGALFDSSPLGLGIDRLEFRGSTRCAPATPTATGQVLGRRRRHRRECLEALRPAGARARRRPRPSTPGAIRAPLRRGVGVACMLVRLRQHLAVEPVDHPHRMSPTARRSASGRGRHRPGLQHRDRCRSPPTRSACPGGADLVSATPT
jgi:hypothetical protein